MAMFHKKKPSDPSVKPGRCFICHAERGEVELHAIAEWPKGAPSSGSKRSRWICGTCADRLREGQSLN